MKKSTIISSNYSEIGIKDFLDELIKELNTSNIKSLKEFFEKTFYKQNLVDKINLNLRQRILNNKNSLSLTIKSDEIIEIKEKISQIINLLIEKNIINSSCLKPLIKNKSYFIKSNDNLDITNINIYNINKNDNIE